MENRPYWDGRQAVQPDTKALRLVDSLPGHSICRDLEDVEEKANSDYTRSCQRLKVPVISLRAQLQFSDSEEEEAEICEAASSVGTPPPVTPSFEFLIPAEPQTCLRSAKRRNVCHLEGEILRELQVKALELKPGIMKKWVRIFKGK